MGPDQPCTLPDPLARTCLQSGFLTQHKVRLAREIADLRRQAEVFNNPAHYVKCAKYQRLANAKEKELAALQESKAFGLQDKIDSAVSLLKVGWQHA